MLIVLHETCETIQQDCGRATADATGFGGISEEGRGGEPAISYVLVNNRAEGNAPLTVQELGGWRTLAMIERYSHLSPQHKARAIERLAEFQMQSLAADNAWY